MYYSSPQINPVRNAVSSSEQTSLRCSSLPTQRARCTDRHAEIACVCLCVYQHTYIAHTHTHTLSQRGAGGEKWMPNARLSFSPSDQLMCSPLTKTVALMWTVHDPPSLLSLSLCLPSVSFFLSCSPCSLRFVSPFHTASSYICSFQSCKWLQVLFPPLHATALPPLTLSLCPFLPSQPPTNASFHHSCCSLSTPWSRPSHKLWSAVNFNFFFFYCLWKRKEKEKQRQMRKEVKGHFRCHYCL